MAIPETGLQLRSLVKANGDFELSLVPIPVVAPGDSEIVVKLQGAPINPSDLALLTGPVDMESLRQTGNSENPVVSGKIPERFLRSVAARLDQSLPVGNEGAGVVVAAGASAEAQALMGKTVAILGGAMYSQYRTVPVRDALVLRDGTTAAEGASCFVNPLTALSFVETMRKEGHAGIVHTAAASNLGQMLVKICLKDDVPLVNVVRSDEQVALLKGLGARWVVDSSKPSFMEDLVTALVESKATLAFDAIGGGKLGGQILTAMEIAANRNVTEYNRYGSNTFKQLYIYGGLDTGPTELTRGFGFAWSIGGYLLTPFLQKAGIETVLRMRQRVVDELKTTFASHYTKTISLREALDVETLKAYARRATGEKYLIDPSR